MLVALILCEFGLSLAGYASLDSVPFSSWTPVRFSHRLTCCMFGYSAVCFRTCCFSGGSPAIKTTPATGGLALARLLQEYQRRGLALALLAARIGSLGIVAPSWLA